MRQELDATTLLDAGLVPVEDAAAALGIEPKRLRELLQVISPRSTIRTVRSYSGVWWTERDAALGTQEGPK